MKKQTINFVVYCILAISVMACGGKSQENNSSTSLEATNTEWTQWINQYESLVEKTIALHDKIKSGDTEVMDEAATISKEMTELSSKLEAGKNRMSASESKRLIEIIQKIKH